MAKYSNVVEYNIVTDVDTSGITKLQNELVKLKQSLKFDKDSFGALGFDNNKIEKSIQKVNQLQSALTAAFNPKIGTLDLSKLNNSLQKEHTNLQMIVKDWESMGARGNMAISSLSNALLSMNKGAVTVNTTLSKIANTFSNTVRWGITASIFQEMMSSVQGAVSYMKNLDESLTQIQMVTNSSKENMRELAQYANNAAQALGSTTTDYTNAVKVFVQEGFSESESKQYANLSTKLANVSEQSTATTSDQITAFRNAFQLDYEQTVAAMDKVANVANNTASNVNELMTASQRAASVAQAVGSSQDSFLAAIATIESVTRQSAEEIGNGLKTIYQRFADIKVSGSTEDGVDYGQYANALKSIGVDVLDAAGEFKGMDQILQETQEVWSSLSDTMKVAVGEKVAGKFQYNRFAALMNHQDYYEKALAATGEGSEGMMDQMNEIYTESIEGRLKTLQAAGEQVMSTLFNQDDVEPVIETLTSVVNAINDIVDAAGGLQGVLPVVGGLLMRTFSTELASSITNIASSIQMVLANSQNTRELSTSVDLLGLRGAATIEDSSLNAQLVSGVADNYNSLSENSREKLRDLSQQILQLEEEKNNVLKEQQAFIEDINIRAAEEQRLAREKVEIDEEDLILKKEEIEDLERTKVLVGSLPDAEEKRLQYLKEDVANLENIKTDYDEIVQACAIYNEQLLRGEALGEEELKTIKQWKNELNGIGINTTPLDDLIIKSEQINKGLDNAEKTVGDILNTTNFEAKLNNITKAIGSLSSAFMGVQMLGEMFKTLSDETATAEEKFTAFTMNGLMGITMLLPVVIDFVKAIAAAKEGSLAFAAAEKIRAAASAMANGALLLNPVVLGIMAAVAAAAIAIAVAHEAIFGAVDRANRKFEEQKEILDQTKKSYQELDEKVEDITSKMESISDAKQSLSEMAKGTEEWKDKVEELNDQIYELLEAYPELIEFVKSENGVLSIDTEDDGYKEYITDLKNQKLQARQSSLLQQGNVKKAENNAQWESFKLKYGDNNLTLDDISNKTIDELKDSINNSRKDYPEVISALNNLKRTIDTNNTYVDNINSTISGSLGYTNYAGIKVSDYENPDLSQYKTVNKKTVSQPSSTGGKTVYPWQVNRTNEPTKTVETIEWKIDDKVQKAIKQYYADLKNISEITSDTSGRISFKYDGENGKQDEKIIESAEVENVLKTYFQSSQYIADSFTENAKIFEKFGAVVDQETQEFKNSEGEVITSLSELGSVSEEQAAIMNKMADQTYHDYMTRLYGSVEEFAGMVASGQYANSSEFADREAGYTAFTESQRLEGLYGDQYQSMIESLKSELGSTHRGEDILLKYNSFETIEDFTRAVKNGTISLDGLSTALDKITSERVDLTKNINGNEFTNRIDISSDEEKFKDFLDDSGMTEGAFSRMSRDAYEEKGGYYQVNKESLEKDIENQEKFIATLGDSDEALKEEQQKLAGMRSELEDLDDAAKDSTAMILRMSNGVVKLRNNIDDISEVLTNEAFRGTTEWYEALDDLDKGLSEVLNIDAGTLSDTFLESGEALDYARRMAEGDMSAIDDLRNAASEDIIQNLAIQEVEGQDVKTVREQLLNELNQLQADISANKITVTTDLDKNPFIQKLNEMLKAGQISAEQASNILSSIGMDAHLDYIEGEGEMPGIKYVAQLNTENGFPSVEFVPVSAPIKGAKVKFPVIRGAHYTGKGTQTANTAARNPSYTGGYSNNPTPKSSSSSPKKSSSPKQSKNNETKKKQKSEWDYLTDITNDLERQAAIIEKLSKLENRLYGANRVKQLKTLQAEHKKNIKLLEQEEKIAKKHAERLRTKAKDENGNLTINGYAYRAGISQLKFDGQGNLENGRQIEQALLTKVNQATKDYNKHRNDNNASYYNQKLDIAKNDYDGFLKAMSDYQATLGKIEDIQSEKQEEKEQLQDMTDAIVDSIQEGIEDVLKAMNNQREFDRLSRNWKEGGNSYSHFASDRMYYSEGLSSLLSPVAGGKSTFNTQLESLQNRIKDAEDVFDGNSGNADDEKLREQDAFENLQEATEHVMDSLNKMVDYYDSLIKTIQEASDKMDELIDNRLEQYDRLEDYLDTRLDQLTLLFGDKSYGEQAEFYSEKINVNMQKMVDISTAIKEKQTTVDTLKELEEKGRQLSSEEREELKDAKNKVNELQKEQLSTETKLLQDISNKLKAQTSAEMDKLVKNLFNGADVEWLSEQWEIATRNSEKYLDDYNRAFELEKLQLKFQEALNDSQNTSLKTQQRIADLGDEYLTYLREKNKLSEYDVKQAEAQLNILQKQIALEEARDNKSQMRLQRNAAGNYDFVYAADQNAMNQAAEALLAAQQESYNLSKQKYLETYNSAYEAALKTKDMVVNIATDASISVEERTERIKFVLDSLNEYLQGSSVELNEISINLYNDFVEAENLIAEENQGNLSAIFEEMRINTAALIAEINAGINSVKETGTTGLEDFQDALSTALPGFEEGISNSLNNIKGNVSDSIKSIEESLTGNNGFQGTILSVFDKIKEEGSNSFDKMAEDITKESDDGHLKRIRVGTINTANEISEYITNTTLPTINSQFALSGQAVLTTVENIHGEIEKAFNAITGAGETSDVVTGEGEKVEGYLEQFQKANKQALEVAGQDFSNFKTDSIDVVDGALNDLRDTTQDWKNDLTNLNVEISNCKNEIKFWKEQIDNAINSTAAHITKSNDLQKKLSSLASQASTTSGDVERLGWAADWATETQYNAAEAASNLAGEAYNAAEMASQAAQAYRDMAAAAAEAANAGSSSSGGERWAVSDSNGVIAGKKGFSSYDAALRWARKSAMDNPYIYQYDTGGYTGTWSFNEGIGKKNGKLAVLHQKELVLNATDTENILSAVELVRDIMSGINSIPSLGKLSNQNNFNDTIEQRVEINATFPGVTEVEDIKQALIGLADNAYQYANKYKY